MLAAGGMLASTDTAVCLQQGITCKKRPACSRWPEAAALHTQMPGIYTDGDKEVGCTLLQTIGARHTCNTPGARQFVPQLTQLCRLTPICPHPSATTTLYCRRRCSCQCLRRTLCCGWRCLTTM
jgi:hypothetical protein